MLNCLVGCDANPEVPEVETPNNKGSIAVGRLSPETEIVILTNGVEYEYQTPPPKSVAMREEMRM